MTIQVNRADFRRAISIAALAVERRNSIPILDTVRCTANGSFAVTGTDLDMAITASVDRTPGDHADFALMAPREVVRSIALGGDAVRVDEKDGKATIGTDGLALTVGTLPADNFPLECQRPLDVSFSATISPQQIRDMDRCSSAISTEKTRYYLNGLHFKKLDGQVFRAAATDGHRLCCVDLTLPDAVGDLDGIILPRKAISLLIALATKAKDGVKFSVGTVAPANSVAGTAPARSGLPYLQANFRHAGANVSIVSKSIDGTFPDYSRVIPQDNDKRMLLKVADLKKALLAVSGMSKRVRAIRLALTESGARISAYYAELSFDAAATIDCGHKHAGFEIGFNGGYLLSMIDACGVDEIVLTASDPSGPVLIQNPADTAWLGVLMPTRV